MIHRLNLQANADPTIKARLSKRRDETKFIALEMLCHDDGWRRKKRREKKRQGNLSESMRLKRAMCYLIDFDCFLYFTVYVIWISNIRDNAASISETSLPQDFDNSFRNFLCAAVNCVLLDGMELATSMKVFESETLLEMLMNVDCARITKLRLRRLSC